MNLLNELKINGEILNINLHVNETIKSILYITRIYSPIKKIIFVVKATSLFLHVDDTLQVHRMRRYLVVQKTDDVKRKEFR